MKRREIIKSLSLIPFAGGMSALPLDGMAATTASGDSTALLSPGLDAEGGLVPGERIFQSIGVEPFVNCKGTNTIMGGSVARPEVRRAMESAAPYNVQLDELAMAVGKRLAELTGAEWGIVSAGCAAGIKLATAACLTGGDPEKLIRLPNLSGFPKDEVIIPRSSRNVYDHAVRNSGVKIVTVDTEEELRKAINARTAMIYMIAENKPPLTVKVVADIANPQNVPVFVDAAAHILTIPEVHLAQGAAMVGYSGGKGLKGPACSGLLLGRKDLLMSAWQANSPHHGYGRDNKIGREEQIGMLAAIETWVKMDHPAEMKKWVGWLENIGKRVSKINGVKTEIRKPDENLIHHVTPYLSISWDPQAFNVTAQEVATELGSVPPRVAVGVGNSSGGQQGLSLVGYMMIEGNDKVAGDRIYEVLSRKRAPKTAPAMQAPATDISGNWDLSVEYLSSTCHQQFFIAKQDGNWLSGTHKTDFSVRDLHGSIDGSKVKFESNYVVPGDRLVAIFHGTVSGDTMSGEIDLGEHINAKFTAKRHHYPSNKKVIVVPTGWPQSS